MVSRFRRIGGALCGVVGVSASLSASADPDSTSNADAVVDESSSDLASADIQEPDTRGREFPLRRDERAPPGYRVEERVRGAPLAAGLAVGGVAYVLGAIAAGGDGFDNQKGWLMLPVVGPWITLGARDNSCPKDSSGQCCTEPGCPGSLAGPLLVLDGLMQGVGGVLVTIAIAAPGRWAVRGETTAIVVVPHFLNGEFGLSMSGRL